MYNLPNTTQQSKINVIVKKHLNKAKKSKKETAWQDAYRLGMDEVISYCVSEDISSFGSHIVEASLKLNP